MSPAPPPPPPKSPPKSPPTARVDGAAMRRLKRFGVSGRRLRRGWTRQRAKDVFFTLVYVVPLTLLIWVWAQDQQIETATQQNVTVAVNHTDAQKVVTLLGTEGGERLKERPDGAILVDLTLQGPRAGLDRVIRTLRDESPGSPFKVELHGSAARQTTVGLRDPLADSPLLRDAGVGVLEVSPADVIVSIEDKRQVQATVVAGGKLPAEELAAPPVFDPPTVAVEGPADLIGKLVGPDGGFQVVADLPADAEPGEQTQTVPVHLPQRVGKLPAVSLGRPDVKATFTRRPKQQVELALGPVALVVAKPAAMEATVVGRTERDTLSGLVVEGSREAIARLRADESAVQAVVTLRRYDDAADPQTIRRAVRVWLPEGVTLKGEPPEVAVRVSRRDATP